MFIKNKSHERHWVYTTFFSRYLGEDEDNRCKTKLILTIPLVWNTVNLVTF